MSQISIANVHQQTTKASLKEMASTLNDVLGRAVTAYIVAVRTPKTITRWANGEVLAVRDRYSEERLLAAYQVVRFMQEYEADSTIRNFMLGMNPGLEDEAPATALRNGDFADVLGVAKAFVTGSYL